MTQSAHGGFYISQIKQLQDRIFERLLKAYQIDDFNGPQGRILFVLWQQDHLTIHEIGAKTSLAKTTLTSMLERMEKKGYVQREPDAHDRRVTRVRLTEKSRAMNEQYVAVSARMGEIFYRDITTAEIEKLDELLLRILTNLKEFEEPNGRNDSLSNQ